MIEPEDDGGGDADGGHEGVGAAVVTGGDASPVLEAGKQVLDLLALAVEVFVVGVLNLAVGCRRDAWGDAAHFKSLAEPVAIVALVSQQFPRLGQLRPRDTLRFQPVGFEEALALLLAQEEALDALWSDDA